MEDSQAVDGRRAWVLAGLLWVSVVSITAAEIAPASVLPLVAEDLGLSPTGVSWLISVFLLGMVVFSLPAGFLLDRVDDRRVILLTAGLFLVTATWSTLAAWAGSYPSLLAARFIGGAMNVILWTAAVNVVGAAFAESRQGTGIGFLVTSIPVGFAVSHVLSPAIAAALGWPMTLLAFGASTLAAAVGFFAYTVGVELGVQPTTPDRAAFAAVLANRWVWAIGGLAFVAFSLNIFFNNWLPSYLVDVFGFSLAAGGLFAAVFPAIGAVGRLASGSISDRFMGGRRNPIVLGSFVVVTPLIVVIAAVHTIVLLLAALVVAGFATQMGLALLLPYARELVDENVTATAISVVNLVGFVGAFLTPVVTGWLIERAGDYTTAFGYAFALAMLGVLLAWVVPDVGRSG